MASRSLNASSHDPYKRPRRHRHTEPHLNVPNTLLLITAATLLTIFTHVPTANAAPKNATIDDTQGDELTGWKPMYFPTLGSWDGARCTTCMVKPDPAFAYRNTYSAATYRKDEGVPLVEFSFQFTGSALYVFLTLAHNCGEGIVTLTETNFTIDDGPPEFYRHTPDMRRTDFDYQYPAFVREDMEHRVHTFRARTSGPDYHIFLNFDYATYTYDDTLVAEIAGAHPETSTITLTSRTSTSTSTSAAAASTSTPLATSSASPSSSILGNSNIAGSIAGGVVGALTVCAIFIFGVIFIRQRARRTGKIGHAKFGVVGGGREYPDPEVLASSVGHLGDTRYAVAGVGDAVVTPFVYTNARAGAGLGSAERHSSSGSGSGSGSGGRRVSGPRAFYTPGRVRYPQPIHKDRFTGTRASDTSSTGLTDSTVASSARTQSNQQNSRSVSRNPNGVVEGATTTLTSLQSTRRGVGVPPATTATTGTAPRNSSPSSELDAQMNALQNSIRLLIADLQSEREALAASGIISSEAIQDGEGLRKKTETLRRMAEQMSLLRERGGGVPLGGCDGERRASITTQLPEYDTGVGIS